MEVEPARAKTAPQEQAGGHHHHAQGRRLLPVHDITVTTCRPMATAMAASPVVRCISKGGGDDADGPLGISWLPRPTGNFERHGPWSRLQAVPSEPAEANPTNNREPS